MRVASQSRRAVKKKAAEQGGESCQPPRIERTSKMSKKKRILHCWQGKADQYEIGSDEWVKAYPNDGTCMLEAGHKGDHEFTPDDEILICFDEEK